MSLQGASKMAVTPEVCILASVCEYLCTLCGLEYQVLLATSYICMLDAAIKIMLDRSVDLHIASKEFCQKTTYGTSTGI